MGCGAEEGAAPERLLALAAQKPLGTLLCILTSSSSGVAILKQGCFKRRGDAAPSSWVWGAALEQGAAAAQLEVPSGLGFCLRIEHICFPCL